jgi:hypothetical protein
MSPLEIIENETPSGGKTKLRSKSGAKKVTLVGIRAWVHKPATGFAGALGQVDNIGAKV